MSDDNEKKRLPRSAIFLGEGDDYEVRSHDNEDWGGYDKAKHEAMDAQIKLESDRGLVIVRYNVAKHLLEKIVSYLIELKPKRYLPKKRRIKKQNRGMGSFAKNVEIYYSEVILKFGTRAGLSALAELRNICAHEDTFDFDNLSADQKALLGDMIMMIACHPHFMSFLPQLIRHPRNDRDKFLFFTDLIISKFDTQADKLSRKVRSSR